MSQESPKFTPGPWQVGGREHDDWGLIRAADGYPVATANVSARLSEEAQRTAWATKTTPPEIEANANLIAAAPEMYAALDGLMHDIGGGKKFCGHECSCCCAFDAARAALNRANGESE